MTNSVTFADQLIQEFAELGVEQCFITTGGAAMFVNDALAKEKRIKSVPVHHEQTASMAAEGYFKTGGKVALVSTTAGPGAINTLNGVFGAFTDSVPMIIVSGQAKTEHLRTTRTLRKLRQLGDQEADVLSMVQPITKVAIQAKYKDNPRDLARWALSEALSGRPGPVWLDVPIDVQSIKRSFTATNRFEVEKPKVLGKDVKEVVKLIREARRPVFLVGSAFRTKKGRQTLKSFSNNHQIVIQPAWTAIDLIPVGAKNYGGRPSVVGDRAGGLVLEAADLIVAIGTSLPLRQVGFNTSTTYDFKTIQIDGDRNLRYKSFPVLKSFINADPISFLESLDRELVNSPLDFSSWCSRVTATVTQHSREKTWDDFGAEGVNPYRILSRLVDEAEEDAIFACADASASVIFFQTAKLKENQRAFTNGGSASMGYELPAAIGAYFATKSPIYCIAGDGSLMQNLQELTLLKGLSLDIRVVVIDNNGYLSIRTSQDKHFSKRFLESPASGLPFPDFEKIANGFGLAYKCVDRDEVDFNLTSISGPTLIHLKVDPTIGFSPKSSSKLDDEGKMVSAPISDLEPFMPKDDRDKVLTFLRND